MTRIWIRADDFGMTRESCQRIVQCIEKGPVNGVSILANGCLSYGAELLKGRNVKLSVHLNFVEGKGLCCPDGTYAPFLFWTFDVVLFSEKKGTGNANLSGSEGTDSEGVF